MQVLVKGTAGCRACCARIDSGVLSPTWLMIQAVPRCSTPIQEADGKHPDFLPPENPLYPHHDVFEQPERLNPEMRGRRAAEFLERRVMRQLLQLLHCNPWATKQLLVRPDAAGGQPLLARIYQWFPHFPTWLVAGRIEGIARVTLPDLCSRFTKSPLYQAYRQAQQSRPRRWQGPCGYVFESGWGALMLIHDDQRSARCGGICIEYAFRRKGKICLIRTQSFRSYIETLVLSPDVELGCNAEARRMRTPITYRQSALGLEPFTPEWRLYGDKYLSGSEYYLAVDRWHEYGLV
jgi:hypothetical protein